METEHYEQLVEERTLELARSLDREKALNDMKAQFVSMASHEFRTPLSTILSSIGLIELYDGHDHVHNRAKHIERIKAAVFDLTSILDDFLTLDKLEHGKVAIHRSAVLLRSFLQGLLDEMGSLATKKELQVHFRYRGDKETVTDPKVLRNILLNLLSNALKYSPSGKRVWLSACVSDKLITLNVRDEGIGIPEEAKASLFKMFFRGENAVHIQGTGLGLNIVQRYVELLQGSIRFRSSKKTGTVFSVRLPVHIDR